MQNVFQMTVCDTVGGKAAVLLCTRLLRKIEGRRIVYEGTANGKPAIIKIFSSRLHGWRHFERESKGFENLALRGIETAAILGKGHCKEGWVLVLEKIENAEDIFTLFNGPGEPCEKKRILAAVLELLAKMHRAGVVQRDMHLGNFLWDGTQVYALDPARMRFYQGAVGHAQSLRQAAILMTNFQAFSPEEKKELLSVYFRQREWKLDDTRQEELETIAHKISLRTNQKTLSKTLRSSKRFVFHKTPGCQAVFGRAVFADIDLSAFMANLDAGMEAGGILKRGNTCFVSKIKLNDRDVVIKRYNHKGLWYSLRHTIKGSRAKKCWLFGHWLMGLGIACAKPVAFIEQRKFGLIWQSYIINEFVKGQNIRQFLDKPDLSIPEKKAVMEKTQSLLTQLVEHKMTHNDLKPSNILIANDNPVLIDLDSIRRYRIGIYLRYRYNKMVNDFHRRVCEKPT